MTARTPRDPLDGLALYAGAPEALAHGGGERARMIVTPNLDHWRVLHRSAAFRRAYRRADVLLNDSRFLNRALWGGRVPTLTGADLALPLLDAAPAGCTVMVVGCPPEVEAWLRGHRPDLRIEAVEPSRGYVFNRRERRALAERARALAPRLVFVCTGAPQSEIVAAGLMCALAAPCDVLCCGSGLQFAAGLKPRAPALFQRFGLEWLWRMISEPHTRLRYLQDAVFLLTHAGRLRRLAPSRPRQAVPEALAPARA